MIGEGIRSGITSGRRVGETSVRIQREGTVARACIKRGGERIGVRVVRQHPGRGDHQRGVLGSRVGIGDGDGRGVGAAAGSEDFHIVERQVEGVGGGRLVGEFQGGGGAVGHETETLRHPALGTTAETVDRDGPREQVRRAIDFHLHRLGVGVEGEDAGVKGEGVGLTRHRGEGLGENAVRCQLATVEADQFASVRRRVRSGGFDEQVAGGVPTGEVRFEAAVGEDVGAGRVDRERHRDDVGIRSAVVGMIGERIGAGVAAGRGVGEAAVGIQCQRSVAGADVQRGG